jgi:putative flippase GtrA
MKNNFHQIYRFLLSGGSATLLHYSVMAFLIFLSTDPVYATAIGALCGAVFNYALQYHYTFKSRNSHLYTISIYSVAAGVALLSNSLLFILFYDFLHRGVLLSQLITTAIVTIQNYLIYKYVIFSSKEVV